MLADAGMVKMYSKSVNVNDLDFAWTGPLCCMDQLAPSLHGLALLLVPTVFPPGAWFCHTLLVHTAPYLHLPLFSKESFLHTLYCALAVTQSDIAWHTLMLILLSESLLRCQHVPACIYIATPARPHNVLHSSSKPSNRIAEGYACGTIWRPVNA